MTLLVAAEAIIILILLYALVAGQPASIVYDRELSRAKDTQISELSTEVKYLMPTRPPCSYAPYGTC
jgi:flagellar biosynthesis/type III secretory pathway M-ring protein FliF/YscJ